MATKVATKALKGAAKKAAKKAPKKAGKKAAKKGARHGDQEMRKAYEHLHRVRLLHNGLGRAALAQVQTLTELAQAALAGGDSGSAAHLLRAAEHLAFGSLAANEAEQGLSAALVEAADAEFEHLRARAEERSSEGRVMPDEAWKIFDAMVGHADQAYAKKALPRALEMARGAEALTHVEAQQRKLGAGKHAAVKGFLLRG